MRDGSPLAKPLGGPKRPLASLLSTTPSARLKKNWRDANLHQENKFASFQERTHSQVSPELRCSDYPVVQDSTFLPSVPQPMREKIQDPCPGQRLQKITYMEIGGGLIRKDGQFVQSRIATFRQAEGDWPKEIACGLRIASNLNR
jgi:hypothetical protein